MSAVVLLVEDDLDLAGAIKMGIEDEGWRVEHVADGTTGLAGLHPVSTTWSFWMSVCPT